jgi:hypothetical protein
MGRYRRSKAVFFLLFLRFSFVLLVSLPTRFVRACVLSLLVDPFSLSPLSLRVSSFVFLIVLPATFKLLLFALVLSFRIS